MRLRWRLGILVGLIIVVCCMLGWKARIGRDSGLAAGAGGAGAQAEAVGGAQALPILVDIGQDTCEPCRRMAPILREIAAEYTGRLVVRVVDLEEDPSAAERFGVYLIPTQVFLDEDGNEVYRHVGYIPKEEIVAILEDMGVH